MNLSLLIVLGLALAVNARDCVSPNPIENFDITKYEGLWYTVAINTINATDKSIYEGDTCYVGSFKNVDDHIESKFNYLKNGTQKEIVARLALTDKTKGLFTVTYTSFPKLANPTYRILCTDYNNYAVAYTSKNTEDGKCSEVSILLSRDRTKLSELTSNDDVKTCIQEKLNSSVDHYKQVSQTDC